MSEWQPIETAPREPLEQNHHNDFLPGEHGPIILLAIPYSEPATFPGFWQPGGRSEEGGCWRFLDDDGANDIQPTHWCELPAPPA